MIDFFTGIAILVFAQGMLVVGLLHKAWKQEPQAAPAEPQAGLDDWARPVIGLNQTTPSAEDNQTTRFLVLHATELADLDATRSPADIQWGAR